MDKIDDHLMRELWSNSLRIILKQMGKAPVEDLSRIASLDCDVVTELATQLCASGEFFEEPVSGGNKIGYRFNGEYKLVMAICVAGKDRVVVTVSNLYGEYLAKEEITASPDTLEFFDAVIEKYRAQFPAIAVLSFGMAGFEEPHSRRLLTVDFPKLEWISFRDHFKEKYELPVIVENETKAAVLAFYEKRHFGEGKCVTALYVPPSYGPGSAICIDGKLYRGKDNAAGEVIFLNTDVRWRHFEYHNPDYSKLENPVTVVANIALPMIVFFNPDCLVIYSDWLPPDSKEKIYEMLLEAVPREFLPEITFTADILPDAVDGLVRMALKKLEPKVDFEKAEEYS